MASTYSPSLKLELMGNGDQAGTWGQTTNNNLGTLLEQAITGVQTITLLDADHTLTNLNGSADEARNAVLIINGTTSAIRNVIAPSAQQKTYIVQNSTVGGFGVTIKTSTGAGVTIPYGATQIVFTDGTNFYLAASQTVVAAGAGISVSTVGTTATVTNTGVITASAGTGVSTSITGTNLSIANTGITSIAGTANEINASASTGDVTLSLPATVAVNISGNAATATTATNATNATNAITATNVSGGTVSATTGSFSSSLTVPNGQFATNAANLGQIPGHTNGWTSTSFALNTTYTNNTSRPLFVIFTVTALRSYINVLVAGVQIAQVQTNADPSGVLSYTPCMFVVPPSATYEFTGTGNLDYSYTL